MSTPTITKQAPKPVDVIDAITKAEGQLALQKDATELLERVAADQAAKADEPSGIVPGADWSFIHADPNDHRPYLKARGLEENPDHEHRWISTDPRVVESRLHKGWSPVKGGTIKRGDRMLAHRPADMGKRERAEIAQRQTLAEGSPMRRVNDEAAKLGFDAFDGSKSPNDGLR